MAVDDYLYRVGTLKGNWIFLPQDEQKLSKYDDRYVIVNYDLSPAGNCWKQTWLLKQIQENRQEIRHLNKILQNTNDVGVKTINKFNPIPYSTLKNSYFVVYRRGLGNI